MTTEPLALDFKSATLYTIRVVLHSAELADLKLALATRMADAGSFFENEPVVIDASRVDDPIDWKALIQALQSHRLPPIGVVAEGGNLTAARAAGLTPVEPSAPAIRSTQTSNLAAATADAADAPLPTVLDTGDADSTAPACPTRPADVPPATDSEDGDAYAKPALTRASEHSTLPAAPARAPHSSSALVINKPLRSGQRVYARQCDLIVVGMVSRGAEVIADGNIHVYGPLRGKAMAGARGDTAARIFTTQLDAELLAVAGVYRVVEAKLDPSLHNRPALVRLDGETLHIEKLGA